MDDDAAKPNEANPNTQMRTTRIRRGFRLQGAGGLLLLASFFMPAVQSCGSPDYPAELAWDLMTQDNSTVSDWCMWYLLVIAPYLFGLMVFVGALFAQCRWRAWERIDRPLIVVIGIAGCLASSYILVLSLLDSSIGGLISSPFSPFLVYALLLFQLPLVLTRRAAAWQGIRFMFATCVFGWFVGFIVARALQSDEPVLYGMWCSAAGAALIVLGILMETSARSATSFVGAFVGSMMCRLDPDVLHKGMCVRCGYELKGLVSPRCPECGLSFCWEDYGGRDRLDVMAADELI